MDTLERINQLMQERGWTKYKLAQESGIYLSSIANMFRRGNTPTVATIETICKAFGISMSQFFEIGTEENMVHLTDEQKKMFDKWAALTDEQKQLISQLIDNMK